MVIKRRTSKLAAKKTVSQQLYPLSFGTIFHKPMRPTRCLATTFRDAILGDVSVSCSKRPAFLDGKKLTMCIGCLKTSVVQDSDTGDGEATTTSDLNLIQSLVVDASDLELVGKQWVDREDNKAIFTLLSVEYSFVEGCEGEGVPVLIGNYEQAGGTDDKTVHFSTMTEIRKWITDSSVTGPLSDRELRLLRRNASISRAVANVHQVDAGALGEWDDSNEIKSLLSNSGFVIEEVLQRAAMSGRGVWYQVSYNLMGKGKGPVHVWEPSSAVPREAIERWKNSRAGFRYTPDERELMKQCAGSMKENQKAEVFTNAGIFATVMNCGVIVSIFSLVGAESLTQVYAHVTGLYRAHGDVLPCDFGYDDGCHLRKFAENRKDINTWARSF